MRLVLLVLGALTLAVLWLGPFPVLARHEFWAHMTLHVGVVAVAAPCLALAVAGSRADPVFKSPWLFAAIPASVVELMVVWAWHAPGLHHAARQETAGFVAEQGTFLLCGLWVWLSAFGGDSQRGGSRTVAGVLGLLLTSMHMTLLGALLALAPRPLYREESRGSSVERRETGVEGTAWRVERDERVGERTEVTVQRWGLALNTSGNSTGRTLDSRFGTPDSLAFCLPPLAASSFTADPSSGMPPWEGLRPPLARRGLTPLQDLHLGGAIMLLVGGASYLLGGLCLTVRLLRPRGQREGGAE